MKLVPIVETERKNTLPNGSVIYVHNSRFYAILLGCDQLMVARIHGTLHVTQV